MQKYAYPTLFCQAEGPQSGPVNLSSNPVVQVAQLAKVCPSTSKLKSWYLSSFSYSAPDNAQL